MKKILPFGLVVPLLAFTFFTINNKTGPLAEKEIVTVTTKNITTIYSVAEVAKHNSPLDCWMIINTSVLDITTFIASGQHNPEITRGCGVNATAMFKEERKHRRAEVTRLLDTFTVGTIQS